MRPRRGFGGLAATFIPGDLAVVDATIAPAWAQSLETVAPNVTRIVEDTRGTGEAWYDALARVLPVLASTYQQKQLLQVQVERARQGLAPLDVSQYAGGVQVGLSPGLQRALIIGGSLALALGAVYLLRRR